MTIPGKFIKMFWQVVASVCGILLFLILIVAACGNLWTWLFSWALVGWMLRREIGEKIGPAIVWCIDLLIVLLGGWKPVRYCKRILWTRTETFPDGVVHEYLRPMWDAANEQEQIWLREKFRKKSLTRK